MRKHWNEENAAIFRRCLRDAIAVAMQGKKPVGKIKDLQFILSLNDPYYFGSYVVANNMMLPAWVRWEILYAGVSETVPTKVAFVRYSERNNISRWDATRIYVSLSKLLKRWGVLPDNKTGNDLLSQIAENYKYNVTATDLVISFHTSYEDIVDIYNSCDFGNYSFCMRSNPKNCLRFYAINAEAGRCILLTRRADGLLITKAWLWKMPDGNWYLDKVYNEPRYPFLYSNNYTYNGETLQITKTYKMKDDVEIIALKNEYFPYMDSFNYAVEAENDQVILTNNLRKYDGLLAVNLKLTGASSWEYAYPAHNGYIPEMRQLYDGTIVPEDEAFYCDNCCEYYRRDEVLIDRYGVTYCTYCGIFAVCDNCNEVMYKEEVKTVDDKQYCSKCHDEYYYECDCCGYSYRHDEVVFIKYGKTISALCQHCCDTNCKQCERCDDYYFEEDIYDVEGESWCCDCVQDAYYCEKCDKYYRDKYNDCVCANHCVIEEEA